MCQNLVAGKWIDRCSSDSPTHTHIYIYICRKSKCRYCPSILGINMMMWWYGFPLQRASNAELWYFICHSHGPNLEQKAKLSVIWDAMALMWCHCSEWAYRHLVIISATHLTHWGRVTHKCVGKLTIIGSDNGLSPGRRQTIIWTNAGILLIGPLGTNFNEILINIQTFSFKKMHLKVSSAKWRPCCLGLNVLTDIMLTWTFQVPRLISRCRRPFGMTLVVRCILHRVSRCGLVFTISTSRSDSLKWKPRWFVMAIFF